MTQNQAKKFWFGWQKEGAKPGKAWKVLTSNSSTQKYSQTGTERCPVFSFELFESHRLEKAKAPSYPFFIAINHKGWREKLNG